METLSKATDAIKYTDASELHGSCESRLSYILLSPPGQLASHWLHEAAPSWSPSALQAPVEQALLLDRLWRLYYPLQLVQLLLALLPCLLCLRELLRQVPLAAGKTTKLISMYAVKRLSRIVQACLHIPPVVM